MFRNLKEHIYTVHSAFIFTLGQVSPKNKLEISGMPFLYLKLTNSIKALRTDSMGEFNLKKSNNDLISWPSN